MSQQQQSPINLRESFRAETEKGYLKLGWSHAIEGECEDGDHGIVVTYPLSEEHYLELNGKKYHLLSFHFHEKSEHLLEDRAFDAEMHVVHQNLEDCSFAVVGVFLQADETCHDSKETRSWIGSFEQAHDASSCPIPIKLLKWLPDKRDRIMRYEGSLTTSPFTETVSWIVFPEPKLVSPYLLKAALGTHPQGARGIQPLNRRFVLNLGVKIVIPR